jgi:hypothetical protein
MRRRPPSLILFSLGPRRRYVRPPFDFPHPCERRGISRRCFLVSRREQRDSRDRGTRTVSHQRRMLRWICPRRSRRRPERLLYQEGSEAMMSVSLAQRPNKALERTADRREDLHSMTSILKAKAQLAVVSGRSACSR